MYNRDPAACQSLVDYMAGEMTDVERRRFERHLASCAACREDAAEWHYVWHRLSEEAPLIEPPAALRGEVLEAAFASAPSDKPETPPAQGTVARHSANRKSMLRRLGIAAVLLAVFVAGFASRGLLPGQERPDRQIAEAPSQIERLVHLAPVADVISGETGKRAYGIACVIRSAGEQRLVVYVFGTPETVGGEAYHVWLLKDGVRSSAGTFTVGESGVGLLSMPWPERSSAFDQVGITLEPNAESTEPMGPKMFGSV